MIDPTQTITRRDVPRETRLTRSVAFGATLLQGLGGAYLRAFVGDCVRVQVCTPDYVVATVRIPNTRTPRDQCTWLIAHTL